LRLGDLVVAILLLGGALIWIALGVSSGAAGSIATVEVRGKKVAEIPLGHENYLTIKGALGPVLIGVDGSGVRILDTRCPRKLCVRMGAIGKAGEWIACVPNQLVIKIEGSSEVDAITPGNMMR
jgi:hypothetical protein